MLFRLFLFISVSVVFLSCQTDNSQSSKSLYQSNQSEPEIGDWVIIALRDEPKTLNPTNFFDEYGENITHQIFQRLLDRSSYGQFELIPQLAINRPDISQNGLEYTFEIKKEAKWDNGSSITAEDVIFSMKVYKHPLVNCAMKKPYFDLVKDIQVDPNNNKKFTFILESKYMLAESALGIDFVIFPQYIFDPNKLLKKYTLKQFIKPSSAFSQELNIIKFAKAYNDHTYAKDPVHLIGSGPYVLESWEAKEKIVLIRKEKWWADDFQSEESLEAYPKKIIYRIIPESNTAIVELKAQRIDVLNDLTPKLFVDLSNNEKVKQHYNLDTVQTFIYSYLGMNNKPKESRTPFFTDKNVRRAMAHLVDLPSIINHLLYGIGKQIIGPIFPLHKGAYNSQLLPVEFSLEKAKELLTQAGWNDHNADGTLEKEINGKKIDFAFQLIIPAENELRKNIAILFQKNAEKVGVKVEIVPLDFAVFLDKQTERDFDMYYGGWSFSPAPLDLKQVWHTEYWANGGSNDVGFGNAQTDKLIEQIRVEMNESKRNELYKKFQELVYDSQPYIFLVNQQMPIAIHKRFRNATPSPMRPGFQANALWTPKDLIKYK